MSTATSSHGAVTVNDSADQILAVNSARRGATIVNNGSVTVFLGKSTVSTANGIPLAANQSFTISQGEFLGAVYGITASGSADVRYWEFA